MRNPSRRRLLKAGTGIGLIGALPQTSASEGGHSSPDLEKFVQPLPVPEERTPDGKRDGAEYHHVEVTQSQQRFHPELPKTTIWGYDGQFPGPIIAGWRGERLFIEFDNSGMPAEHLLEIDERIPGTTTENYPGHDDPVPEVRNVTHFHGLNIPTADDGQADMWTSPDGVTGPRFSKEVQEIPNRQGRTSTTYHDHARGISRLNNYAGLVGPYYIRTRREQALGLPDGEQDLPLVLLDRMFEDDGSLQYPASFKPNVAGDVATVNGAIWPYMEVEPRRYRFRILSPTNGRTWGLRLSNESGHHAPLLHQFAAGHGFLEDVVSIGHGGTLDRLYVAPFERADVIVDFSGHAGETLTLTNKAEFPFGGGHGGGGHDGGGDGGGGHSEDALTEIMQFHVTGQSVGDTSTEPANLRLPYRPSANPQAARTTRHMKLQMTRDEYGIPTHVLNNRRFDDPIQHRPQLGTTEIWKLENNTMHTHPIHLHLVEFEVIGRGHHGHEPPHPNERGGKDTVRVNPGETVRIAVQFGDYTGMYPFHCHILEHEDHDMMRPFEVVAGESDRTDHPGRGRGLGHDDRGPPENRGERSRGRGEPTNDRGRK